MEGFVKIGINDYDRLKKMESAYNKRCFLKLDFFSEEFLVVERDDAFDEVVKNHNILLLNVGALEKENKTIIPNFKKETSILMYILLKLRLWKQQQK